MLQIRAGGDLLYLPVGKLAREGQPESFAMQLAGAAPAKLDAASMPGIDDPQDSRGPAETAERQLEGMRLLRPNAGDVPGVSALVRPGMDPYLAGRQLQRIGIGDQRNFALARLQQQGLSGLLEKSINGRERLRGRGRHPMAVYPPKRKGFRRTVKSGSVSGESGADSCADGERGGSQRP